MIKTHAQLINEMADDYAWNRWDEGYPKDKQASLYKHEMEDSSTDFKAGYLKGHADGYSAGQTYGIDQARGEIEEILNYHDEGSMSGPLFQDLKYLLKHRLRTPTNSQRIKEQAGGACAMKETPLEAAIKNKKI